MPHRHVLHRPTREVGSCCEIQNTGERRKKNLLYMKKDETSRSTETSNKFYVYKGPVKLGEHVELRLRHAG